MARVVNGGAIFIRKDKKFIREKAAKDFISRLEFLIKKGVTLDILEADIAGHAKVSKFVGNRGVKYLNERLGNGSLKLSLRSSTTIESQRVFPCEVILQNK